MTGCIYPNRAPAALAHRGRAPTRATVRLDIHGRNTLVEPVSGDNPSTCARSAGSGTDMIELAGRLGRQRPYCADTARGGEKRRKPAADDEPAATHRAGKSLQTTSICASCRRGRAVADPLTMEVLSPRLSYATAVGGVTSPRATNRSSTAARGFAASPAIRESAVCPSGDRWTA